MAFVVEDGTGKVDSNAYVSVEAFINYWIDRGLDLTDREPDAVQAAIVKATDYVEVRYGQRWRGIRSSTAKAALTEQALSWPRAGVYTRDGVAIKETVLPPKLIAAICEYAKRALSVELLPDPTVDPNVKSISTSVGPVRESIEYAGAGAVQTVRPYPMADRWLDEFTAPGGGVIR